jgi:sugar lactone lactonase YvrE
MTLTADLVFDARDQIGECLVWNSRDGSLWWTDISGARLHRLHLTSGDHRAVPTPARVGSFAFQPSGGLVLAMEDAFGLFDPATGKYEEICAPEAGMTGNRFNDGRCDRRGRFFAGSMYEPRGREAGALWRLDPDRSVHRISDGVTVANGLAWSPDDRIMYWADSPTSRVWTFDYNIESGTPSKRRLWLDGAPADLGRPDGCTVDAEGCYWSARYMGGKVIRYTPGGRVDRIIHLPVPRVTMCAFGGADLKTLYITTAQADTSELRAAEGPLAGALFAIATDVSGLPEPDFGG